MSNKQSDKLKRNIALLDNTTVMFRKKAAFEEKTR